MRAYCFLLIVESISFCVSETVSSQQSTKQIGAVISGDLRDEYLIGAEYYPWYYRERWNYSDCNSGALRTNLVPPQPPVLGTYVSSDSNVITQHLEWCAEYGINVLILEYIQPYDFVDNAIKNHILMSPRIADIHFTFLYDWAIVFTSNFQVTDQRITKAVDDFKYLADTYFSHPQFLKIHGGRPVVFIYVTRALYPAQQVEKLASSIRTAMAAKGYDIFLVGDEYFYPDTPRPEKFQYWDAIFGYDVYAGRSGYAQSNAYLTDLARTQASYKRTANSTAVVGRTAKVGFIPSCTPGFNDRAVRRICANNPALARRNSAAASEGSMFESAFTISMANLDSTLNMVHITSFNEWHEDTQIEPSVVTQATTRDNSSGGTQFTQGLVYEGYGTKYLEIIRNKVIAISGSVKGNGQPLNNAVISVYDSATGEKVAEKKTLTTGKYVLSSRILSGRVNQSATYKLIASAPGYTSQTRMVTARRDSTVTGVDFVLTAITGVEEMLDKPARYRLMQNYPNPYGRLPFNLGTSIRFQVSAFTFVSLKVYDVLGREVRTLVQELKSPGVYDVELDASGLPGGVYFYRLTAGQFTDTKKMIVGR